LIRVEELTKVYRVPVREPGLAASLRSLFWREYREVVAVDKVSFQVEPGERVGFLGPNGAGKTTTLKMLTGLLHPTSGRVEVLGYRPQDRRHALLGAITLVMGQKQQLLWDLPATETFELNRALFDIPRPQYRKTLDELIELLDLGEFLDQPARNLSLGQRMRCELCASLLHRPKILFLDEPTIGLDVEVQALVRGFVAEYNQRHGATVMLTSHDMTDVAELADRILLIDRGKVRFDGSLSQFTTEFGRGRRIQVAGCVTRLDGLGFTADGPDAWSGTFSPEAVNRSLAEVLKLAPHATVTVADPPLEEILTSAFGDSRESASA